MTFTVRFDPRDVTVELDAVTTIGGAAVRAGLRIDTPCGGHGQCTGCRVHVESGAPPPTRAETARLGPAAVAAGWRLACQASLERDATVHIPPAARVAAAKGFGADQLDLPIDASGHAIALDVGSTTIAAALVDRATTRVSRSAALVNEQLAFGDDVLARVLHAQEHGDAAVRAALMSSVGRAIEALDADPAIEVFACGNAVMTHFLLGADTRTLGVEPFEGTFTDARECELPELGGRRVRTFPLVGGHVGGDAVAAALACGLDRVAQPEVLIDLGTNCEIVLATPDRWSATSAAAGPAFEGGGIVDGMRADPGAVDRVSIDADGRLDARTIDDAPAIGVCGTGIIDAVAALLDAGVVDPTGRMRAPAEVGDRWRDRMHAGTHGDHRFVLTGGDAVRVSVHARDVRALQLAKAAVGAGLAFLLDRADLSIVDIGRLHLCGSFGARLPLRSLRRIGLLDFIEPSHVRFAGDAAAIGVRMAACSGAAWRRALALGRRIAPTDAASDPDYVERFAACLPFPPPVAATARSPDRR